MNKDVLSAEKIGVYEKFEDEQDRRGGLLVKPARQWIELASKSKAPLKIWGPLWYEGELCILFSDTNLGKSALAVQMADVITSSVDMAGFRVEVPPQPVLYADFELSARQFKNRYSAQNGEYHKFDKLFYRAEFDLEAKVPEGKSFETHIIQSIEQAVREDGYKIIIVDNITYLSNATEKAADALPLMKKLKELKARYDLSMLVLAHTPKRDLSKPLTRNDLQGSKMLINFCDSSFAIGESEAGKNVRYIKQIKSRNTEIVYDKNNVAVLELTKRNTFLGFSFQGYSRERDHLPQQNKKEITKKDVIQYLLQNTNLTQSEIAEMIGVSRQYVSKVVDNTS